MGYSRKKKTIRVDDRIKINLKSRTKMKKLLFTIFGICIVLSSYSQGRWQFFPFERYNDHPGVNPHITTKTIDLTVYSISEDNNGIWIAGSGAYAYYKDGSFRNYKSSLINTVISTDTETWLGTELYKILVVKNDFSTYPITGIQSTSVKSLLYDKNKSIWCGTSQTLDKFENNTWTNILFDYVSYVSLFQDSKGSIWAGTNNGHILCLENNIWKTFTVGTWQTTVNTIVEDKNKNIWFGTTSGIYKYCNGVMKLYYSVLNSDLKSDYISTLCIDKYNNMWIGYSGGILSIVNSNKQWTHFSPQEILGGVSTIVESKNGRILIGTQSLFGGFSILEPLIVSFNYSKCAASNGGYIIVNSCHLTPPLQYSIDNGITFQSDSTFKHLNAGIYNVAVKNSSDTIYYGTPIELKEKVPELGIDMIVDSGDSVRLNPGHGFSKYTWSTNDTTETIMVDSTGVGNGIKKIFVSVENNGCIYTDSIKITFRPNPKASTAIVEKNSIYIFPNPVKNNLTIDTKITSDCEYIIYDILGHIQIRGMIKTESNINIERLKQGIYYLKLFDNKSEIIETVKLIKI